MTFDSFGFIFLFLPVAVVLYRLIAVRLPGRGGMLFLIFASALFYTWNSPATALLLVPSCLFNCIMAQAIARAAERASRRLVTFGVTANVVFLCWFKYAGSALPLGISFFTIQQIMYLMDAYEGLWPPNSLLDHAVFVSYFPYIGAGPISRARDIVPQFRAPERRDGSGELAVGLARFAMGLFKKTVFADTLGRIADAGFASPGSLSLVEGWLFPVVYALEMYFDFSGYTDMAIGGSRMMGIVLPENFNNPFRAKTISEFWQRWHMTLTAFITTYLYTPIVRSFRRVTLAASAFAVFCAMSIAGVWHGAGVTFLIFGAWHGAALALHQYWRSSRRRLPDALAWLLTLATVVVGLMFFRSSGISAAAQMIGAMTGAHGVTGHSNFAAAMLSSGSLLHPSILLCAACAAFFGPTSAEIATQDRLATRHSFATAALLLISLVFLNSAAAKDFLYVAF